MLTTLVASSATGSSTITLLRLFGIALLVVAPYGVIQLRKFRKGRTSPAGDVEPLEMAPPHDPHNLAPVIERLHTEAAAIRNDPTLGFEIRLSESSHVDGQRMPPSVLRAVVLDAAANARLTLTELPEDATGHPGWRIG